ncbi:MAG TPA: TetR family transcriptional regulator [Allosphingosinicella sp.]|jgi:AcrR family transcriptional regulator
MTKRQKNAAATREALLEAARRRFLEESYDNVGLRDVAKDAGVDVALVGRYFGSKEELFREVLRGTCPHWLDADVTAEALPAFLARLAIEAGEGDTQESLDRLLIILRSASSPATSELVRTAFVEDVLEPVARLLPGEDAQSRAAVAFTILMGTKVLRTILGVQPLLQCQACALEAKLELLLTEALLKPLSGDSGATGES